MKKSKGFSVVLIAVILAAMISFIMAFLEVSTIHAAINIGENVCSVSGRSVLSEFNKALFEKYNLFALKDDESFINERVSFYINHSIGFKNSVVYLKLDNINVNTTEYSFINSNNLSNQMKKVAGSREGYCLRFFSNELDQKESSKRSDEVEYLIAGFDSKKTNIVAIKAEIFALRFSYHFSRLSTDPKKMKEYEAMYYSSFQMKAPNAADLMTYVTAEANTCALSDVSLIFDGESVEENGTKLKYQDFLRRLIALIPERIFNKRSMAIIENNISTTDKPFRFSEYIYGFGVEAKFIKRNYFLFDNKKFYDGNVQKVFTYN